MRPLETIPAVVLGLFAQASTVILFVMVFGAWAYVLGGR